MRSRLLLPLLVTAGVAYGQTVPPRVRIVQDLRLDATAENFSSVRRIGVGPHREIVVSLPQDRQLRMYDSTGKRIATIGRRGNGPGEFQSIGFLGWTADTMWVNDPQTRRVTFVAPDGKVLRTITVASPLKVATSPPPHAPDNSLLAQLFAFYPNGSILGDAPVQTPTPSGQVSYDLRVMVMVPPSGPARPLAKAPSYEDPRWSMTVDGFGEGIPFAFTPDVAISMNGDRFAYLIAEATSRQGGTFTASLFKANGDTMFVKTFPFRGVPIPKRVADSALAAMIPAPGTPTEGPKDLHQRFQAIARQKMPAVYEPVQSIVIGLDKSVWITLRATAEGSVVMILNERGDQIGSMLLPPHSTLRQASATRVWTTETDADGLASVVRYRVSGLPN